LLSWGAFLDRHRKTDEPRRESGGPAAVSRGRPAERSERAFQRADPQERIAYLRPRSSDHWRCAPGWPDYTGSNAIIGGVGTIQAVSVPCHLFNVAAGIDADEEY